MIKENRFKNTKIVTGDTVQFKKMRNELWNMVKQSTFRFDSEDLLVEKDVGTGRKNKLNQMFNQCLKEWREFPKYKYLVNFLFSYFPQTFTMAGDNRKQLFLELEEMEKGTREALSEEADQCLAYLAESILEEFEWQEPEKEDLAKYTLEKIKGGILDFTEDFLLDFLAPVLCLTVEEVNVFLRRVLKRDELDYYQEREFLLYIALNGVSDLSMFHVYRILQDAYGKIEANTQKEKVETDTVYVLNRARMDMEKLGGKTVVDQDGRVDENILHLMEWHKSLVVPGKRTVQKEYERLLADVCRLYTDDVKNYNLLFQRELGVKGRRENSIAIVRVFYEPDKEVVLPAKMEMWGEKNTFDLYQKKVLPARTKARLMIPVESVTDIKDYKGPAHLPEDGCLTVQDDRVKEKYGIVSVKTFTKKEKYPQKVKPAFVKKKDKGTGFVWVEYNFACPIPVGTVFVYEDKSGKYIFKTKEYVHEDLPFEDVEVSLKQGMNPDPVELKSTGQPYDVLERKGQIKNFNPIPGVVRIANLQRVTYQEARRDNEEDDDEIVKLTVHYKPGTEIVLNRDTQFYNRREDGTVINVFKLMKDTTLQKQDTRIQDIEVVSCTPMPKGEKKNPFMVKNTPLKLVGEKKPEGFLGAWIGDDAKPRCYASEKPEKSSKMIRIHGAFGMVIPTGTEFFYEGKKGTLLFKTVREEILDPYASDETLEARWVDTDGQLTVVQRRSETGEEVYAFPNTITSINKEDEPEGFLSVTNPKAARAKMREKKPATEKEFVSYLYSGLDLADQDSILDELEGKIRVDINSLREPWFTNTYFTEYTGEEFAHLSGTKKRSIMLTLTFLRFVKQKEQEEARIKAEESGWSISPKELSDEFKQSVRLVMSLCRMNEFDIGNPLDAFFAHLLLDSYPYDTLRILYKMLKADENE